MREITEAAEQRNVSALSYHFGSREGLLDAILAATATRPTSRGANTSPRSGATRRHATWSTRWWCPTPRTSCRPTGATTCGSWRSSRPGSAPGAKLAPGTGPYLREILGILEERPAEVAPAVRRERVVELIMLMTVAMAERARAIESQRRSPELDEPTFVENLTDVLVGVLEAPVRGAVP